MKNAVIALLMAKSANAQKRKAGMEQDYDFPAPALIAAEWNDYKCTDQTVAAAQTALTGLEGALKTLKEAKTPLDAAVTKAVTAKTAAVKAVVDKDAAAKADIAADDAEDLKELTLRRAMNDASYALAVAKTAKTAADSAKAAKDSEKAAADKVKTAMDTAKSAADSHLALEKAETIKLKAAYDAAKKAYLGANGLGDTDGSKKAEATAKGLYDAAIKITNTKEAAATAGKKDWDTKKATTDAAKAIYDAAVTAKGQDTDAAKPAGKKKTADAAVTTAVGNGSSGQLTQTFNAWDTAIKATSAKFQIMAGKNSYTQTADKKCTGTVKQTINTKTDAECKALCEAKKAWDVSSATGKDDAAYCYAYIHKNDNATCDLVAGTTFPAASTAASGYKCNVRDASTYGKDTVAPLYQTSKDGAALQTAYAGKLAAWKGKVALADTAQGAYDIADKYVTAMKAPYDSAKLLSDAAAKAYEDGSNNNAGTKKDWTTAKADSDGKKTTYDSRAKTAAAEKLAMENAKTAWENQVKEEAAQDAVQKLAVADVATQTAAVAKIATAQTTASTGTNAVATAASATQSAKQQAYDSAKAAYDAQVKVTAASGAKAKTPLDALVALRKTATDAAKTLADAIAKAKGQQALIDAKQKEVDTATATHLAAIVKCKENQYDAYRKTLATAEAQRKTDLAAIEKLVDAAKAAKPKAGATGARCEKAMSNGTFRPKRGEKVCTAATDCCGAAKGAMGGATMTIETCQPKTTTKYKYQPPRAPMATAWPAQVEWPFVCIDGASKLAAAASALAAAYMLA